MKIKYLMMAGCLMLMLTACKTPTNVAYLQDSNDGDVITLQAKELKLKPADKISIVVNTKSVELNNVLNLPMTTQIIGYSEQQSLAQSRGTSGYTIDSEGFIDYPLIGKVKVAGLSREQVAAHLKATLEEKNVAKDAVVTVEYTNMGFSVLGDVLKPGFYEFTSDRTSVLQALSKANDMNITGNRREVKVLRTEGDHQVAYVLNLQDHKSLMQSPAYYLQQNDVVYVDPNNYKKRQSTANASEITKASFWLSAISVLTTVAVLIFK
jgi:polysaccharide export outer membrane protein